MKKVFIFITACLSLIACNKESTDTEEAIVFSVEKEGKEKNTPFVEFLGIGGQQNVKLVCANQWKVKASPSSWIRVSPEAGSGVTNLTITTDVNPERESRLGTLYVTSEGIEAILNISQSGTWLELSSDTLFWGFDGGHDTIKLYSNVKWETVIPCSWISLSQVEGDGDAEITITANKTIHSRVGNVSFISDGHITPLTVVQKGFLQEGTENGYNWVNLGLPSETYWSTYNVGASSPDGFGIFLSWGETEAKEHYGWENYKWRYGESVDSLAKYNTLESNGIVDNLIILEKEDDAASVIWGGGWQTPKKEQWQELMQECTWVWTSRYDTNGYEVVGKNGASIFLPATGVFRSFWSQDPGTLFGQWWDGIYGVNSYGNYWSSSLNEQYARYAWHIYFDQRNIYMSGDYSRHEGRMVRPVL